MQCIFQHTFGVRGHQSGFLDMSRCCLRALCDLEIEKSSDQSFLRSLDCRLHLYLGLALITAYEWLLWVG